MVRIGRRPEYRFEIRSFNMQTHHSRDIWPAFNPLKPVGKDGIRSRLPDVFYQWLQLSSSSCTKDVFIRLQDAPHTIENWPQVRYIAIWTQHTRELNFIPTVTPVLLACALTRVKLAPHSQHQIRKSEASLRFATAPHWIWCWNR